MPERSVVGVLVVLSLGFAGSLEAQPTGSIVVEKQTLPDGSSQQFNFSGAIGAMLGDGGSAMNSVAPGMHTVTETVPSGWALASIVCDDTDSTGNINTATATFNVADGETVTCVFTNAQDREIVIEKQTLPDGSSQLFSFSGAIGAMLGDGGSASVSAAPGMYTVTETVPAGWALASIVCDDTDSTGDVNTATATFNVSPGERVTCVFTNAQNREIVVEKQTLPDGSPQQFTFGGAINAMLGDGGSASVSAAPGMHTVTETVPPGWALDSIVCDDTDSTGNVNTATATFNVSPGERVTCVFTNAVQTAPALPYWATGLLALLLAAAGLRAVRGAGGLG